MPLFNINQIDFKYYNETFTTPKGLFSKTIDEILLEMKKMKGIKTLFCLH